MHIYIKKGLKVDKFTLPPLSGCKIVGISVFIAIFAYYKHAKLLNVMLQFMALGTTEIVLIVLAVVLLFGGKKIPELMKGVGQGVRSFKDGMKDVEKEINATDDKKTEEKK